MFWVALALIAVGFGFLVAGATRDGHRQQGHVTLGFHFVAAGAVSLFIVFMISLFLGGM